MLELGDRFSSGSISLGAKKSLGKGYERGSICSVRYQTDAIPKDSQILEDVAELVTHYRTLKTIIGSDILNARSLVGEEIFQESVQNEPPFEPGEGPVERPPQSRGKPTLKWVRDSRISAQALQNANFTCAVDWRHETFQSARSKQPFMEAHHLIPMEFQNDYTYSLDVPENILSLCPTCHRKFHLAEESERLKLVDDMYEKLKKQLEYRGIAKGKRVVMSHYRASR